MKYNICCDLQFDVESDAPAEEIIKIASQRLTDILPHDMSFSLLKAKAVKSTQKKIVLGVFAPEEVLPYVVNTNQRREYKIGSNIYRVGMNSHRYFVFRTSRQCAACGLKGTLFHLEQNMADKCPHFNLYAEDHGELVLMTVDHIRAKANGGKNIYENYQVLCSCCNNLKGSDLLTLQQVAELRKIYNENKRKTTRKQLSALLRETKAKFTAPPL